MLLKVKFGSCVKVCRSQGSFEDLLRAVTLVVGHENMGPGLRMVYIDGDGETIEIVNQDDFDACLEEHRLLQRTATYADVKVVIQVLTMQPEDFEEIAADLRLPGASVTNSQFLADMSLLQLEEQPHQPCLTEPIIQQNNILFETSVNLNPFEESPKNLFEPIEANTLRSLQPVFQQEEKAKEATQIVGKLLADKYQQTDALAQADNEQSSCACKTQMREEFQKMFIELLTTRDQATLNSLFPIMFEPKKLHSEVREATNNFLKVVRYSKPVFTPMIPPSTNYFDTWRILNNQPATHLERQFMVPQYHALTRPTNTHDMRNKLQTDQCSYNMNGQSVTQFYQNKPTTFTRMPSQKFMAPPQNRGFFEGLATHIGNIGKEIKHVFIPENAVPDPSHIISNDTMEESLSEKELKQAAEQLPTTYTQAPADFTLDQQYFLAKLKQYLKSEEVPAIALFWIKHNWAAQVGERNILGCFPEMISAMEKDGIIKSPACGCTISSENKKNPS